MPQPIKVTLPDASVREFPQPVTALEVAKSIGAGLAKAAVGAKIDGTLTDLSTVIDHDCALAIVTPTKRDKTPDSDALFLLRHSTAHVMAEAIQRIVPRASLAFGPPNEAGFFYDMWVPPERPLTSADFEAIEREMAKIIAEDRPFTRREATVAEAQDQILKSAEESDQLPTFKLHNALRAAEAVSKERGLTPKRKQYGWGAYEFNDAAPVSFYVTGEPGKNWEDLCKGPHLPSTGRIGAFKIMSLASSYWQGDESKDRLTRVYGTAFFTKEELEQRLHQMEEAKKRDHRVLGKQHDLFHIDEDVGQGLILWSPNGAVIRTELQNFISAELTKQGYKQVYTPNIGRLTLYRTSGHFPYYQESQYPPVVERETLDALAKEGCSCAELSARMTKGEVDGYLLKPMNCPMHIKIYASRPRSYRDLPLRLAEFGTVYRWEQSGELNGMTRVRGFTQDDAHLFCTEDQVAGEMLGCLSIVKLIFGTLGMKDYRVRVGLRDPDSNKYVGDTAGWDKAEQACRDAARTLGVSFSEEPGEAAFYGPKIDFIVRDVIGREWQLGTVQVDYNLPKRFNIKYIGADNHEHTPVMIHRAPFGSMERFIGVLIEHFAGAFPTWLSPEQARVLPISDKTLDYGREVLAALKGAGVRATLDESNDRIQAKVKVAANDKVPYMLVVGPRDAEQRAISLRARGIQKDLGSMPLAEFVAALRREIDSRAAETVAARFA